MSLFVLPCLLSCSTHDMQSGLVLLHAALCECLLLTHMLLA